MAGIEVAKAPKRKLAEHPALSRMREDNAISPEFENRYATRLKDNEKANKAMLLASGVNALANIFSPKMRGDVRAQATGFEAPNKVIGANIDDLVRLNQEKGVLTAKAEAKNDQARAYNLDVSNREGQLKQQNQQAQYDADYQQEVSQFNADNQAKIKEAELNNRISLEKVKQQAEARPQLTPEQKLALSSQIAEIDRLEAEFAQNSFKHFDLQGNAKSPQAMRYKALMENEAVSTAYYASKTIQQQEMAKQQNFVGQNATVITEMTKTINNPDLLPEEKASQIDFAYQALKKKAQEAGLENIPGIDEEQFVALLAMLKNQATQKRINQGDEAQITMNAPMNMSPQQFQDSVQQNQQFFQNAGQATDPISRRRAKGL